MDASPKIGILEFRYQNFKGLAQQFRDHGSYSVNIGDYVQSRAVRSLLERQGVPSSEIVKINRDTLPSYDGGPVKRLDKLRSDNPNDSAMPALTE